jgi:hypothetical protein
MYHHTLYYGVEGAKGSIVVAHGVGEGTIYTILLGSIYS